MEARRREIKEVERHLMQNCKQIRTLIEELMRDRAQMEERVPKTKDRRQVQRSFEAEI